MYRSFEVQNFRCFEHVKITDLARVNLIAGVNNVGKTALLEALFLHCGAYNPELALRLNAFRGVEGFKLEFGEWVGTPWDSLFKNFRPDRTIVLAGEMGLGERRTTRIRVVRQPGELRRTGLSGATGPQGREAAPVSSEVAQVLELEYEEADGRGTYYLIVDQRGMRVDPIPPPPPHMAIYQGDQMRVPPQVTAERFSNLQKQLRHDVVLDVLRLIEPSLKRLELLFVAGEPIIHGDVGIGELVPLPLMGGGMVRLANLAINIGTARNGVLLVDEIENGVHHSALTDLWRAIGGAARNFDTQIFATTHSAEAVVSAHQSFSESYDYDFRLHRLDRVNGEVRVVTYDREALEAAIQAGLEVR